MRFCFDKQASQNIRKSLRKEWLETNGRGDYASSSLIGCNTRKYHGLLVANLKEPAGRHVLLSTLDESVRIGSREFPFSCRKHPGVYYPHGYEYLNGVDVGEWTRFVYSFGGMYLSREVLLPHGRQQVLIRYTLEADTDTLQSALPIMLSVRPLLAFRHFHTLTFANMDLCVKTTPVPQGFRIQPYASLPELHIQTSCPSTFLPSPDWCRAVEYLMEEERGFPDQEDLFQPGIMGMPMQPGSSIYLMAGTSSFLDEYGAAAPSSEKFESIWKEEIVRRTALARPAPSSPQAVNVGRLMRHLSAAGEPFLIQTPMNQPAVLAGYHWFDAWGRDSLIALPGLTFCAGREKEGVELLLSIGASARNGLIPNCFGPDGNHAYNSVDASLWYVWAVQQMLLFAPHRDKEVREVCWPVIRDIIHAYESGAVPGVWADEVGMLHAGTADTQLTWMDATVNGRPVTSRHGCPVEINALWYNALAFSEQLARRYGETDWNCTERLVRLRAAFIERFYVPGMPGHLADVWRPEEEGGPDRSIRPNMIFAVAMPNSILADDRLPCVVESVRNNLLTPYGLRTLSPGSLAYEGRYAGNPALRDGAYHQGTVWPWLLGAYGDALLRVAWDVDGAVRELLHTLTPLFSTHLADAGVGSISEIFDGNPPHLPNGCIAQAWSVAECLRLLIRLRQAAPEVYAEWEVGLGLQMNKIQKG